MDGADKHGRAAIPAATSLSQHSVGGHNTLPVTILLCVDRYNMSESNGMVAESICVKHYVSKVTSTYHYNTYKICIPHFRTSAQRPYLSPPSNQTTQSYFVLIVLRILCAALPVAFRRWRWGTLSLWLEFQPS